MSTSRGCLRVLHVVHRIRCRLTCSLLSSYSWNQPGNRTSVNYDPSSYEAKRLMLDLPESPTTFEWESNMSEIKFDAVSQSTWKSSHPTRPPSTTGNGELPRTNSDMSLYAPMRRRSIIQTPGVATRASNTEPVLSLSKKSSFRHSQPVTPSQSRKNSMDEGMRIFSLPPRLTDSEEARAVTPCDSEYKQLGSIKFGSLRITNGAPSPYSRRAKEGDPDYLLDNDSKSSLGSGRDKKDGRPTSNQLSPISKTFLKLETGSSRPNSQVKVSEKEGDKKENDFLAGIEFAPFSLDPGSKSPELQTTSKHMAVEDDLFEDDLTTEISSHEVLDVRMDPNARKLPANTAKIDTAQKGFRTVTRSDSGFVSSPTSEHSHKTLSKADSGYSSNVSLRSLRGSKVADKELPPCPVETARRPDVERSRSSTSSFLGDIRLPSPTLDLIIGEPDREAPPPPLPPKDISPTSPTYPRLTRLSRPHVAQLATTPAKKVRQPPAPLTSTQFRSSTSGPVSPVSAQLSPAGSDTSSSALSIGSGSHRPGKLQRLLSGTSMRGPPSVHPTHAVDKTVPSVPHEVEAKLIEHTGLFPITTKRLALRPQPSKDTLGTIFSVGSAEVAHADDAHKKEDGKIKRRRSLQSIQNTIAHAAAAVIPSRKPINRKAVPARDEIDNSPATSVSGDDVIDMDYIGDSAGKSAFDQAFAAMSGERDAYFNNEQRRSMTMNAQMERSLVLQLPDLKTHSPLSMDGPSSSQSSPVTMPEIQTPKTSKGPPVSMRNRPGSVRHLRVPPPLRPQSTPATGLQRANTTSLSRQSSRENIHSYPPTSRSAASTEDAASNSPPAIPPLNPRRSMTLQGHPMSAPLHWDKDWQPRRSASQRNHSRTSSMSSQGSAPYARPASASPYAEQNRRAPQPQLRHRSSYDGHARPMVPQGYSQPPSAKPRANQGYQRQSPDPWTSSHFRQLQQQYGGGGWDANGRYHPPYVPRQGHYRRSSGSHGRSAQPPPQAPYRILHSYNSPAYRHVPIWG